MTDTPGPQLMASGEVVDWPSATTYLERHPSLIVGNGASMTVSSTFGYGSLYEKAVERSLLDTNAKKLFEASGSPNFEQILNELAVTISTSSTLQFPQPHLDSLVSTQDNIRDSLIAVVREVHPGYDDVVDRLPAIASAVACHDWVFTLNYDLLIYWSIAKHANRFVDGFNNNPFDVSSTFPMNHEDERTRVCYLHGGLHLVNDSCQLPDGSVSPSARKLMNVHGRILDQFDPLTTQFVSEGSGLAKLAAISRSDYLSWCLQQLRKCSGPLVIFGTELDADHHLSDAIALHPDRKIALSVYVPGVVSTDDLRQKALRAKARFNTENLCLFDSSTHPLGNV